MSLLLLYAVTCAAAALLAHKGQHESYRLRSQSAAKFYDSARWWCPGKTLDEWEGDCIGRPGPYAFVVALTVSVGLFAAGFPLLSPFPLLLLPALLPWLDAWRERRALVALRGLSRPIPILLRRRIA